jgi:hypothetical protein
MSVSILSKGKTVKPVRCVTEKLMVQAIKDLDAALDVLENIDPNGKDYKRLLVKRNRYNKFPIYKGVKI